MARKNFRIHYVGKIYIALLSFIFLSQSLPVFFNFSGASVTLVNHYGHKLSTLLRIRADPSMEIFGSLSE